MADSPFIVEIPIHVIRETIASQVRALFEKPDSYNRAGGDAWGNLKKTTRDLVLTLLASDEVRALTEAEIHRQLPLVVRECVAEELTRVVKAEIVRQRRLGGLTASAQLALEERT